ncbi:MAG: hypothetical protein ABI565_01305 [Vicinamibacteria bacterium]
MSGTRLRLLAAAATALGLLAGGFEAHVAPQGDSWWHGLTGSPSPAVIGMAVSGAIAVWLLGGAVSVRPFLWMGAGLLPLLPATTGLLAPLIFFSGYTMMLGFAVLLGWSVRDLLARVPPIEIRLAFLIAFVFFVFVGRFLPGPAGPQGDEPHYLLIAESLLRDGDVDLKNQFDERAFSKFTSANLEPHTAPRSPSGKLYAIHTPGLSALIAPGYAVFGFAGARAVMSLLMAGVVALLFFTSKSLFGPGGATFVFFLSTFASPLPIYANALFPDPVSALPVAATLACMVSMRPALMSLAIVSIASLPWMHPRFLPLAAVLAAALAIRGGFSFKRAALAFVPLFASLGLLLLHFHSLFGSAMLSAAYGPGFSADVSLLHIPLGASALILDRQFGLLLFSPVLLLGLAGSASLFRQDRLVAGLSIAVGGVLIGVGGAFSMWWGGASSPARFLIGATPALLLLCGASWQAFPARRAILGAASGFGLGLLFLACLAPRALHNRADGDSGLLRLLAPVLDVDRFFPGFVKPDGGLGLAVLWGLVLTAVILRPRSGLWAMALPVAFGGLNASHPFLDPFASSLRALEAWDDHRRTFGGSDREGAFSLDIPLGEAGRKVAPGVVGLSPRFSLPQGAWTLRVRSSAEVAPGSLNVARVSLVGEDDKGETLISLVIEAGKNETAGSFDLARSERRVRLRTEGLQETAQVLQATFARRDRPDP